MMGDDAEKVQAVDVRWIDREESAGKAARRSAGRPALCKSSALARSWLTSNVMANG